jgi:predicted ATPase
MSGPRVIRTPDQRLRVFVSSTLGELADERVAVKDAIERLRLVPVMFELGARPHPPRELYRAYLGQSHVFVGVYWQRYGWIAPGEEVSGLEDEYRLGRDLPGLFYLKEPAPDREPRMQALLTALKEDDRASYRRFTTTAELAHWVQEDLALLLTERFEAATSRTPVAALPPVDVDAAALRPLPVPISSFVGRDADLAAVAGFLREGVRLVTITGTGGIGKTRLALAVVHELLDDYPDGVHVVHLGAVEEVDLVLPTLASTLGVRLTGTEGAAPALVAHLEGRRALLLLDNLEQVLDVAGGLVALLERCPGVQLLVTSRRPLHVAGEQQWQLEPLGVDGAGAGVDALAASPAVQLFVQRASAVDPSFALHAGNAAALGELCRRLDGLPLAIELAAARVRLFPPDVLLRRLGAGLDLLSGGADRPARHRTLRATIEWSTRLLDPAEHALFARLSVFAGGCTIEAAEAVCDLEAHGDVPGLVARLLDHGLLLVEEAGDEPRVRMLETVRAHAGEHLELRGETVELRRRHLAWFAELADRAQPFLCGPDQLRWLARMDPERANVRLAARNALELGEHAKVLEMGWDLYVYYHVRGAHQEPEAWVSAAIAEGSGLDARQRAIGSAAAGISASWRGLHLSARAQLETALETFADQQLDFETAVVEMSLAGCDLAEGKVEEAAGRAAAASARFAAIGHDWGVGSCEYLVGVAAAATGAVIEGKAALQRAAETGRRIENPTISAQALTALAELALTAGELDEARQLLLEAVPLLVRSRDATGTASALEVLAPLAMALGASSAAALALTTADAARARWGSPQPNRRDGRIGNLQDEIVRGASGAQEAQVAADLFVVLETVAAAVSSSGAA